MFIWVTQRHQCHNRPCLRNLKELFYLGFVESPTQHDPTPSAHAASTILCNAMTVSTIAHFPVSLALVLAHPTRVTGASLMNRLNTRLAMARFKSSAVTAMMRKGWRFAAEGACRPASKIFLNASSLIDSFLNFLMLRRVRICSMHVIMIHGELLSVIINFVVFAASLIIRLLIRLFLFEVLNSRSLYSSVQGDVENGYSNSVHSISKDWHFHCRN